MTVDLQNRALWSYGRERVQVTWDETIYLRKIGKMDYVEITVGGSMFRFIPEYFVSFDIAEYGAQAWWKRLGEGR